MTKGGRTPRQPRSAAAIRRLRQRLELAIEQAVQMLDDLDGDDGLEPSLAVETLLDQRLWAKRVGLGDDREEQCEDEGAQCDDEGMCGYNDPDSEPDEDGEEDHRGVVQIDRMREWHRTRRKDNVGPPEPVVRVGNRTWRVRIG